MSLSQLALAVSARKLLKSSAFEVVSRASTTAGHPHLSLSQVVLAVFRQIIYTAALYRGIFFLVMVISTGSMTASSMSEIFPLCRWFREPQPPQGSLNHRGGLRFQLRRDMEGARSAVPNKSEVPTVRVAWNSPLRFPLRPKILLV